MSVTLTLTLSGDTEEFLRTLTTETAYSADEVIARALALFRLAYDTSRVALLAPGWDTGLDQDLQRRAIADGIVEAVIKIYDPTALRRPVRYYKPLTLRRPVTSESPAAGKPVEALPTGTFPKTPKRSAP